MLDRVSLDDFSLEDTLGVGTVGTIFLARHRESNKTYALKLLSPAVSQDLLIKARFEREVLILSKLHHPNIVSYFGHGKSEGQLFYLMEYVSGGTLKDLLKLDGRLTWPEAAECGRQIAAALQYAHNHGIVHRDLKPGNIFLTEDGTIKLGDFGIARDMKAVDITDAGLTVGTYAYMPPELIRGDRNIAGTVDLYAMGCLLFEMLSGRTPFLGDNFAQFFEQHLRSTPPKLADLGVECPQKLNDVIFELLAKEPNKRPFNARTVQGVLGELTETQTPSNKGDLSASSVRLGHQTLVQRLQRTSRSMQVGWKQISILLGLLTLILAAALIAQSLNR